MRAARFSALLVSAWVLVLVWACGRPPQETPARFVPPAEKRTDEAVAWRPVAAPAAGCRTVLVAGHGVFAGLDVQPYIERSGIRPHFISARTAP